MRGSVRTAAADVRGAALILVLVLVAAAMVLSTAVATSAAVEFAMAGRIDARLRATEAAEAGLAEALRARTWNAADPWRASGTLEGSGDWQVEARLVAARVDPLGTITEWRFEIESSGQSGAARVTLVQAFDVSGSLPGEPRLAGWHLMDPLP
jgi:type II secretory pathway component PulK